MTDIVALLGEDADGLLAHRCTTVDQGLLALPGPDYVDRVVAPKALKPGVLRSLQCLFDTGRLAGTGYLSILPVDQGVAIEGGCNAVASTYGVLHSVARRYAHKIPFLVKINHNEILSYPNIYDQTLFAAVEQSFDMGAVAVGATIYYGSHESRRQIQEISEAFQHAHELGMATVLWAYLRNPDFKKDGVDYHTAADLTGQANHLAATIGADIVKQKQAEGNGGYNAIKFGKTHPKVYSELTSEHPIDLVRYQVANCYMGRAGLINSGGASSGSGDLAQAVRTAVINKRAGGMGMISGRKAFQRPMAEGVELLHAIQDVYLSPAVTIA